MTQPLISRRTALRSACRHCLGLAALGGGWGAMAQPSPAAADAVANALPLPARFARPALDTDEGGLWAMMDREETRLRRSPFAIRDNDLTQYVRDIVCRLSAEHCPDIRVHLMRTPLFNANMAPNGMMQVWSGLLLRVENEAQLAAVLGHEMGHYLERHTVEQLRDLKSRAAVAQFMGIFGVVGVVGQLGVLAGAFAYSRDHEVRADRMGMRLMKEAGYDGRQAALVWDNLLGELKIKGGEDAGKRSPMLATHPPVENRRDDLLRMAGDKGGDTRANEFRQAIRSQRLNWLQDEIKRGQFEESLVLFDRMLKLDAADAQVLYARGEIYRQRSDKDDAARSLDDLTRATAIDTAPPEAWRALGLVYKQRTDAPSAARAFEKYLAGAPDAPDAGLIKSYIAELKP